MTAEELALEIATHFKPAYTYFERKPASQITKDMTWEDKYIEKIVEPEANSTTMVAFLDNDGHTSVRSLTFLEIVEAILEKHQID